MLLLLWFGVVWCGVWCGLVCGVVCGVVWWPSTLQHIAVREFHPRTSLMPWQVHREASNTSIVHNNNNHNDNGDGPRINNMVINIQLPKQVRFNCSFCWWGGQTRAVCLKGLGGPVSALSLTLLFALLVLLWFVSR